MRKIFLMGLLALLFGLFNVSAFAGNAAECSYLKDKEFNPEKTTLLVDALTDYLQVKLNEDG